MGESPQLLPCSKGAVRGLWHPYPGVSSTPGAVLLGVYQDSSSCKTSVIPGNAAPASSTAWMPPAIPELGAGTEEGQRVWGDSNF